MGVERSVADTNRDSDASPRRRGMGREVPLDSSLAAVTFFHRKETRLSHDRATPRERRRTLVPATSSRVADIQRGRGN
jgi:hypothetical protein